MRNNLLYRFTASRPCRLITVDGAPYLERYFLASISGVTFYLHRFVSGDQERHLHNHPWGWGGSVILCGSYVESRAIDLCPWLPDGVVVEHRSRRWFNRVDGNTFHRIQDAVPGTWTLFFHGPRVSVAGRRKGWGFLSRLNLDGDLAATMFTPFNDSPSETWWRTAPRGCRAGRENL